MKYMNSHSFSTKLAKEIGLNNAIMLQHLYYWWEKNKGNEKNYYDGNYWTYNSAKSFSTIFEYWTPKQIRTILNSLEKNNYIKIGNFNSNKYDQTKWYTLTVKSLLLFGEIEFTKWSNGSDQMVKPIPDINTDIKPDIKPGGDTSVSNDEKKSISISKNTNKKKNSNLEKVSDSLSVNSSIPANQINGIFAIFQKINPMINYGHKTQRKSAEKLIKKFGVEKTKELAKYAVSIHGKQYSPTINNPYQLEIKYADLSAHFKRNEIPQENKIGGLDDLK